MATALARRAAAAATTRAAAVSARRAASGEPSALPHLVVFGGSGFIGARVCAAAVDAGLGVVSVSRSGRPRGAAASEPWAADVDYVAADVLDGDPASWRGVLEGAVGVVSTLGGFGSNAFMKRLCGDANVAVFEAAAAAGVPRAAFISVHDYGLPSFVLPGYFEGKRSAERALARTFPTGGVALRPGFVYGARAVGDSGVSLPLGLVGAPLDRALSLLPTQSLAALPLAGAAFVPPVSARAVARAAVAAATDPEVAAGPMDVWTIKGKYGP